MRKPPELFAATLIAVLRPVSGVEDRHSFSSGRRLVSDVPIFMQILIVEDEKKMAGVLKKGLEAENHRVSLAFDDRSGLELATTTEFDVILLDLMLPLIDGFEVARRLRKGDNQTPILMLTAPRCSTGHRAI